jgi:hypothetical protein
MKKYIQELAERFPNVKKISIDYYGSGDSFDSFNQVTFEEKDGSLSESSDNELLDEDEMNDLLWKAIDKSEADFNNEGSEGRVHINLEETTIEVENYYYIQSKELGGGVEPYTPED